MIILSDSMTMPTSIGKISEKTANKLNINRRLNGCEYNCVLLLTRGNGY